jgi:dihydroxy-acid dehydratase
MGAFSANLPCIFVPAGPMLNDRYRGEKVGAGTHTRKFWDERQAGHLSGKEWIALESHMSRTPGTCNTMGTASTMTLIAEAMGLTLPNAASIPAMDSAHTRMASESGARIVEMVWEDLKPSSFFNEKSVLNGVTAYMAMGGSTNAAIHLIAIAGRGNVSLTLDDIQRLGKDVPVLANVLPSGSNLMEDFYYAGGLPALLRRIPDRLSLNSMTVNGRTLGDNLEGAHCEDDEVVRPLARPVSEAGALAVLRGNLAPAGAVIKPSGASGKFNKHSGRALVFDSMVDLNARINDPDLDVDETTVLVLRNGGPLGGPGMPEWGNLPIPKKLLEKGVRDMVRVSDARMSGTHYGTCVLHVAPEAAAGGPLALIRTGDVIELDVAAGRLDVQLSDEELEQRRAQWKPDVKKPPRGYTKLFLEHVTQANEGCDFDFLAGWHEPVEPTIY